jgi:hypothetical protein
MIDEGREGLLTHSPLTEKACILFSSPFHTFSRLPLSSFLSLLVFCLPMIVIVCRTESEVSRECTVSTFIIDGMFGNAVSCQHVCFGIEQ